MTLPLSTRVLASLGLDADPVVPDPVVMVAYDDDEYDEDGERLNEEECSCVSDDDCDCPARRAR